MTELLQKYQNDLELNLNLSQIQASEVFHELRFATDQRSIASFLSAWAKKGVSSIELATCAQILRDNCIKVNTKHENFIDIVGTGGSRAKVFNVSTASAFVISGAGRPVAKHGNRAASSSTGSADALANLGVNIVAETEKAQECLDNLGICFMFAPKFHNLTKELAMARRTLGTPTIFNLLGPLANPANAPYQLIGIWDKDLMKPMAEAIAKLGTKRTWVVHGEDGLDEITLNGKTHVAEIAGKRIKYFDISPEDFGLDPNGLEEFNDVSPTQSAEIIRNVLSLDRSHSAAFDLVLINSAAAIYLSGIAETYTDSMKLADESIRSGAAMAKLEALIEGTQE
ncbi:MAG: anthranilate phosphoribosyltransferase [Acidobacteria bacterium]|nr:anthranilate phosphoribosyltransferase [Acidobacteriota bacterium]